MGENKDYMTHPEELGCIHISEDVLATIARSTSTPIATGERLFTRWGYREVLEKAKAGSLQQLVTLADSVEAPVAAGSQLGTLTITSGEEVVAELPILAGEEIPRVTFGQMLVQMLRTAFLCG